MNAQQTLVPVQYVGKKQEKTDDIAGTGLVWTPNQVHYVPPLVAQKLFKHPDVWAEADEDALDPATVGLVVESQTLPGAEADSEKKDEEQVPPIVLPNLMGMTKPDLVNYAEKTFNQKLPDAMKKEDMAAQIVALANSRAAGEVK